MLEEHSTVQTLEAHVLRFVCEVATPLRLGEYKGSALRGAWAEGLMQKFCPQPGLCRAEGCAMPQGCPITALVGPANEASTRGRDLPRPYVFQPPIDSRTDYAPGDTLEWHMALFGEGADWFPYVVMAVKVMGDHGVGGASPNGQGKGKLRLREIWAENPLSGLQQRLFGGGESWVQSPGLPITQEQVARIALALPSGRITLHFKTPLRLGEDTDRATGERKLLHHLPPFDTLVRRLDGRLRDLTACYAYGWQTSNDRPSTGEAWPRLDMEAARKVVAHGNVEWLDLHRYSSRQERRLPMGGLRGRVTYSGELAQFLPLLVWGQFIHVGKYAVMGNGGYVIEL